MNDTDILTPIQQIQMQITARVIANSAVSATAAVALRHKLREDLSCQKKKCLHVFRKHYYKHLYCPIRMPMLHVVNTAKVTVVVAQEEIAKAAANTII